MIKLLSVKNARWITEDKTGLDCEATFNCGGPYPYTAINNSGDESVQAVWDECQKGEIAPFVQTPDRPSSVAQKIQALEHSITPRMLIEAVIGSDAVFPEKSAWPGKTALEVIAEIHNKIASLRADG